MTDIASLAVRLAMEDGKFRQGMQRANNAMDRMERNSKQTNRAMKTMQTTMSSMKTTLIGFAAAMGASFSAQSVKGAIEFGDGIAKTADKVGVTTAALQEFRFAAERSGVASSALDTSLQRFSRRVGEVAQGTGVLKDVFEQYGIAIKDSNGNLRSNEEILGDYADVIANTTDSQEQLRLAFKAFDREGAGLVAMLKNGKEGMDDLRQAARDADVVMRDDLTRTAEELNDKLDTMTTRIRVKLYSGLIDLTDALSDTADEMADFYDDITSSTGAVAGLGIAIGALALTQIPAIIAGLAAIKKAVIGLWAVMLANPFVALFAAVAATVLLIAANWNKVKETMQLVFAATELEIDQLKIIFSNAWDYIIAYLKAKTASFTKWLSDKLSAPINGLIDQINDLLKKIGEDPIDLKLDFGPTQADVDLLNDKLLRVEKTINGQLKEAHDRYLAQVKDIEGVYGDVETAVKKNNDAIADTVDLMATCVSGVTETEDAIYDVIPAYAGWHSAMQQIKSTSDVMVDGLVAGVDATSQAIVDLAITGKSNFNDMAKAILADMAKILIQTQIMNAITGMFPSLNSTSTVLRQHSRGSVISGLTHIGSMSMAEAGPEAIMPLKRLRSGQLGVEAAGGGTTVNVINNSGAQATVAERETPGGGREIDVLIEQTVQRQMASGNYDRTLSTVYGLQRRGQGGR